MTRPLQSLLPTLLLSLALAAPAAAERTAFAPAILFPGDTLVLSVRADADWKPLEVNEGTNPCFLVGFELRDLAGAVLATSGAPVDVAVGASASFEVAHADLGVTGPIPLVPFVEAVPVENALAANAHARPAFSLQLAGASGLRAYSEKGAERRRPKKLGGTTAVAPVRLAPGETLALAAFNPNLDAVGRTEPCFLVGFELVDADGNPLATTKLPAVDPGEGVVAAFAYEDLSGSGNLPESVAVIVRAQPVALPEESAGITNPCFSLQVASSTGVEVYAER